MIAGVCVVVWGDNPKYRLYEATSSPLSYQEQHDPALPSLLVQTNVSV